MKHTDIICVVMGRPWLRILLFALVNTCFLLVYATASSPMLPYTSSDYDIFRTVALAWRQGGLPYVDIFDNKGPLLYVVYLIGMTISSGKAGLFILEVLLMTWSAELIYRIGRAMNVSCRVVLLGLACIYALDTYMCELGMTVEEISLPFTLLPFLYYIRKERNGTMPLWQVSVIGFCFGVASLIRLNNTALICGLVVADIYNLCRLRRYRSLLREALVFMASVAAVWIPVVVYFYARGALDDMLYCSLIFNLSYVQKWHVTRDVFFNIANCMSCIIAVVFVIARRDKKAIGYIVPISAIFLVMLLSGGSYGHYYILTLPIVVYAIFYASKIGRRTVLITCLALVLPNLYYIARLNYIEIPRKFRFERSPGHPSPWDINHKCYAESLLNQIPEEEYGEIYSTLSFNETVVTYDCGIIPPGKYLCAQDRAAGITDELRKDIILHFREADPKWVLMLCHMNQYWIISQFADKYELADSVIPVENWLPVYYLYRKKE